ncbi:hypothetical protein GCM10010216_12240 [Streptomyces flaveolus]|nr:hypothetical protein GCM10010216_12240 [Streptomyces flaveolus]
MTRQPLRADTPRHVPSAPYAADGRLASAPAAGSRAFPQCLNGLGGTPATPGHANPPPAHMHAGHPATPGYASRRETARGSELGHT